MNFDLFNNIEFEKKELLLRNAKSAERNIMVSPYNTLANARAALEILCKGLIKENNLAQLELEKSHRNLFSMVQLCLQYGFFVNGAAANQIRKYGNDTLHANEGSQKLHVVNEENVGKAMDAVQALYAVLLEVFFKDIESQSFNVNNIPFGAYEIVRVVQKADNEIIFGNYNYFVKDSEENFYYLQIFHRNSTMVRNNELGARGILAENKVRGDKGRKSYLLDVHYPCNLPSESDREYIAYSVYADSELLSEVSSGQLSEKQIIQIAIDLINVLIELKSIGEGIYLRNIQPGNVIITPNGDDYMAGIVNMETAKIEGYNVTVFGSIKSLIEGNPYVPLEVRNGSQSGDIQWDKVDIYSVAKIMVYCVNPKMVEDEIDEIDLYNNFSDDVADVLADIFGSSVNTIDGAEEFKEKLQDAISKL